MKRFYCLFVYCCRETGTEGQLSKLRANFNFGHFLRDYTIRDHFYHVTGGRLKKLLGLEQETDLSPNEELRDDDV